MYLAWPYLPLPQMQTDATQHTAQRQGRFELEDEVRGKASVQEEAETARQMQRAAKANEEDQRPVRLSPSLHALVYTLSPFTLPSPLATSSFPGP